MNIDRIGLIYTNDEEPVALPGYHVNITPEGMRADLEQFRVAPPILHRVWAGDDPENPQYTVPLRFESEEQAEELLPSEILDA